MVDIARGTWQLALEGKGSTRTSTFFGSALKMDLFISIHFTAFFDGSCSSFSPSIDGPQFAVMAAVSGSRRRFSICWAEADSRRAADGFRVRLTAVDLEGICLEGPGLESAVQNT